MAVPVPTDAPQTLETKPLLRFGVIADPQYAPVAPDLVMGRHYGDALNRIEAALAVFDSQELDFVITLGDLVDHGYENFDDVLALYGTCRHSCLFLPGNHDFDVAADRLPAIHARLGMPSPYHDLAINGVRLIIIDGCEISTFAPPPGDPRRAQAVARLEAMRRDDAVNAKEWNGGMSEVQLAWLAERLALATQAGEPGLVFGHFPLHPYNDHALWDADRVAGVIAGSAAAYLCGHDHRGNHGIRAGTHFLTMKGMVDGADQNAFSVVSLYPDRLEIEGHGREQSRTLALPAGHVA